MKSWTLAVMDIPRLRDLLSDLEYEAENQNKDLFKQAAHTLRWLLDEYMAYVGPLQEPERRGD